MPFTDMAWEKNQAYASATTRFLEMKHKKTDLCVLMSLHLVHSKFLIIYMTVLELIVTQGLCDVVTSLGSSRARSQSPPSINQPPTQHKFNGSRPNPPPTPRKALTYNSPAIPRSQRCRRLPRRRREETHQEPTFTTPSALPASTLSSRHQSLHD